MAHAGTLSSKGQVTIPKAVRDRLRLKPGDQVVFREQGGQVVVEPVPSVLKWYGAVPASAAAEDWPEVREVVRRTIGRNSALEGRDDGVAAEDADEDG